MESNYVNLGQCSTKKEVVYLYKGFFKNVGYTVLTPSCGGDVQNVEFTEANPVGYILVAIGLFIAVVVWNLAKD